jgi:type II secretory pathway pseudopilin PulG
LEERCLVESIRSWVADVLGIVAVVVTAVGLVLGRRELRRQQEILKATNYAVEQAIDDLRTRHLSASLSDMRWLTFSDLVVSRTGFVLPSAVTVCAL